MLVGRLCVVSMVLFCCCPGQAAAHVKWFATYNLLCPPRSSSEVVWGEYFLVLCLLVGPVMFAVTTIDRLLVSRHTWIHRKTLVLSDRSQPYIFVILRHGVSAFFIAAAAYGAASQQSFILTPELSTPHWQVQTAQIAIALLTLLPQTAFLAGFGILALYSYAISEYGLYHLLDYPIFLGVAAYLILVSLCGAAVELVARSIMRLCTGVTLLWAAIEKFAYPEWSFALLAEKPVLAFGLNAEFYMTAAGFVEFCAAYLLITGMLAARISAMLLLGFFVSAIYFFGVIDAIGHAVIIVVLVLLILSENSVAVQMDTGRMARTALIHTGVFFVTLFIFIGLYCGLHSLLYPFSGCIP